MDPQEELVRLQVIDLRRQLGNQTEAIVALSQAGFGPSQIAEPVRYDREHRERDTAEGEEDGKAEATGELTEWIPRTSAVNSTRSSRSSS